MRRGAVVGGALLLAAISAASVVRMGLGHADNPAPQASPTAIGVGALGRVEPASHVRRLNHAGGLSVSRLATLFVHEGEQVKAGQLVAEFADAAQKDAAITQAEAALRQANTSLARIRAAGRPEDIQAQRYHIDALRAVESSLVREAARSQALGPKGAMAQETVEHDRFAANQATAERGEAESILLKLQTARPEDVAVAEADVAAAEAALKKARTDALLSRVFAPIDGTVLKIYTRPGEQVGADGLLDMADLDHLDVVADVYETDLPRVRQGAPAEIVVPGDPERLAATVREIGWIVRRVPEGNTDPVAATDARTVEVRLTLGAEGQAALRHRINMQVQVAIRP
jgi:HlyD family secretion protein